jgi:hypothetical protein
MTRILVIGIGATLVMDLWAQLLRRFGIRSLDFALLGRWIGHFPRFFLGKAPPVRGERVLGWCAHYAIGITFAAVLVGLFGPSPSLGASLLIGIATAIAPLFILQPALGAGIASRKTPRPLFNATKSLVTHTVFGIGLYLAANVSDMLT